MRFGGVTQQTSQEKKEVEAIKDPVANFCPQAPERSVWSDHNLQIPSLVQAKHQLTTTENKEKGQWLSIQIRKHLQCRVAVCKLNKSTVEANLKAAAVRTEQEPKRTR